ncbi:MAG: hypothetical protein E6K54_07840 [Gammaproteobacteria bacterium]|nr:MAG: hypothetical protein E6K54_07840 [Gammaproteobacteria bacterium]
MSSELVDTFHDMTEADEAVRRILEIMESAPLQHQPPPPPPAAAHPSTSADMTEADEAIRRILEVMESAPLQHQPPPPPPAAHPSTSAGMDLVGPYDVPVTKRGKEKAAPKVKSANSRKRSVTSHPSADDENAQSATITNKDKNWIIKYPYDTPHVSWIDDSFQYTIQNPKNDGDILLKMHLYTNGCNTTNCCAIYIDSVANKHILSTVNKLMDQLKTLCSNGSAVNRSKMPLCAWRTSRPMKTDVSSLSSSISQQQEKKKKKTR